MSSVDDSMKELIAQKLNGLCKPPGSLGDIETVATLLCRIQGTLCPVTKPRHVTIFAADHGVTCEGVTAWPSEVTGAVVKVMQSGRTASGVFARSLDCGYEAIDVGLLTPADTASSSLPFASSRRGTGNILREPAMSIKEFEHAWSVGAECARRACDAGNVLLVGGEMGIGNTTVASCLIGLLTDAKPESLVGRGAGVGDEGLARKQNVVRLSIERVRALNLASPKEIAAQAGGLEIVALAGFYFEGAIRGATLLIDGLIATSAALVAFAIDPMVASKMIAGHRSTEPGHMVALERLGLTPVLDLKMRLGEGTGAIAALPILDLAASMMNNMATIDELSSTP